MRSLPSLPRKVGPFRALLLGALLAVAAGPAAAGDLTVVSWGGAYTKSQILGFIKPYEEARGLDVEVLDYNGGLGEIRSQVSSYNVKWDVVDLELADALRGCREGLLVKIDPDDLPPSPDGVPARRDFLPGSLTDCGVGSVVWSTVIAFDPDEFSAKDRPDRLEDFFNVRKYPGRRGMRQTPKGNLEWALMADGVSPDRVYDVLATDQGLDRAFRVLSRIKPYIVWWTKGTDAVRMLRRGRVRMSTVYSGRVWDADTNRGADLRMVWDHQIWNMDLWAIVKHTENLERARDFVAFATSTESLAGQAGYIPYGPVRRSSQPLVPEAMQPYLPTRREHMRNALRIDARWWAENFERVDARFEQWLERPVQVPRNLPH
ncbi:MAG TPA: ABC transporter substrate-binding protein [Gammaproteobacteria bacterium]|nr:ABC transporter substrate-binding protein [Gammaproteobacteria bacterium]